MMGQPSAYKRHQKVPQKQMCPFSPRFISKLFNPGILRRKLQILASSTRFHADLQSNFHCHSNLQLWNVKLAQTSKINFYIFLCFLVFVSLWIPLFWCANYKFLLLYKIPCFWIYNLTFTTPPRSNFTALKCKTFKDFQLSKSFWLICNFSQLWSFPRWLSDVNLKLKWFQT